MAKSLEDIFGSDYLEIARARLRSDEVDFEIKMHEQMEISPAHKDYYGAALAARASAKLDGLLPTLDVDLELKLSARQGIKAACMGREDTESIMRIQMSLLQRMDRLHQFDIELLTILAQQVERGKRLNRLAWVSICFLGYIALTQT